MHPPNLIPSDVEIFKINDQAIEIPKCNLTFDRWKGDAIKETFGGKPIVSLNGKPMFAELAIMNHFISDGWDARWIETYGKHTTPICLTDWSDDKYKNQVHNPILSETVNNLLEMIAKNNANSYSGCWDVIGWKDNRILFAESKRNRRDKIRQTQNNWLTAALKSGMTIKDFLIVQWDFNPVI